MNFIVNGYDYKDKDALERRMAAREGHMAGIQTLVSNGQILYAAAMINEKEEMCGSCIIMEMPNKAAVEAYLKEEAYIVGKVWEKVDIIPCKIPPLFRK
jgi:uncharacterized protein YciI